MLFKKKENQNWYLYIVETASGTLYTGIATDVLRRFLEHQSQNKKCAKYLRGKGPLKLVFKQLIGSRSAASKAEYNMKSLSKKQKHSIIKNEVTYENS